MKHQNYDCVHYKQNKGEISKVLKNFMIEGKILIVILNYQK